MIHIEDAIFDKLRSQFETMLNRTFERMERKETDSAEINMKVSISLLPVSRVDPGTGELKTVVKPYLSYKTTGKMALKEQVEGKPDGEYELLRVGECGEYAIIDVGGEQEQMKIDG